MTLHLKLIFFSIIPEEEYMRGDYYGRSALSYAIINENVEGLKYMLDHRPSSSNVFMKRDVFGQTLLHHAVERLGANGVDVLLDYLSQDEIIIR